MKQQEARTLEEQLTGLLRFCGKTLHHGMGGKCSQDRILMLLNRHGTVTQRELMDMTGVQSGSMSEVLGKIEEAGLLRRVKNETDKRNVDVMLTEAGIQEAARVRQRRAELEAALYESLSEEEKTQLIALLRKLADAWRADERIHTCKRPPQEGAEQGR